MDLIMNEEKIERIYEREMDKLDELLMSGEMLQTHYEDEVEELNRWVKEEYAKLK